MELKLNTVFHKVKHTNVDMKSDTGQSLNKMRIVQL